MKKISLLIFFSFYVIFCLAQQTEVSGIIKDRNQELVPYANIIFTDLNDSLKVFGVLGEEDGSFRITLPKQVYKVDISVLGAVSTQSEMDLKKAKRVIDLGVINIQTYVQLDEITVNAEALDYKLELDKKVYNVSKDLLAKGGKLTDIMQNLPSVQVEVDGAVSLRGNANVRILIDGQPSGFTNTNNLLRTIPAHSVESIEVITNPSSKYTSEGSAGIINVVLKKGKKKRLSRSIEVFSGLRINSGINLNLNQGNEKASWYINSGLGYSEPKATYELMVKNALDTIKESKQYAEKIFSQLYFITNIGGQKILNKNNTISADITYRFANAANPSTTTYNDIDEWDALSLSERVDTENIKDHFFQANIRYKLTTKNGSTFRLRSSTQFSKEEDISTILEEKTQPVQSIISKNNIPKEINNQKQILSLDYVLPLKNKAQLEMGLQHRHTKIANDFSVESFEKETWNIIPEFDNHFFYKENISALYGQFAKSFHKLKFQIGLRSEFTDIDILPQQNGSPATKNYIDFFPSGFLTYDFRETNKIRFSISRRIGRPRSSQLIPAISLTDNRNIFAGNNALKPSYSTLVELGFRSTFPNNFSITPTLFYSQTSNTIDYFIQKEGNIISGMRQAFFVSQAFNFDTNTSYGLELVFSYTLTKWLSMFCELRANAFQQIGSYQNVSLNSDGAILYGRYHINFKLPKSIRFQIQNRFRNGNTRGQVIRKAVYRMDIGLSKNFNDRTSLTLNAKDIFDTWAFRIDRVGEDFTQEIVSQVRVPQLNVSFIYQVNQKKYKGKKGWQYDKL